MSLIDSHGHLDDAKFDDDRTEVIERAFEAGVEAMVCVGTEPVSWERTWKLSCGVEAIFPVLGYHPNELKSDLDERWTELTGWLAKHRPQAIGEIGLDYYWDKVPHDLQHHGFRKQIRLAHEMDLPVVIHCREAYDDCLRILEEEGTDGQRGIMHCFSAGQAEADRALDLGMHLSFGGPLTYKKNDELREVAKAAPIGRLLVETDCPYLSPQPRRGKRNEPAFVKFTAETMAEVRGMSFDDLAAATTRNAREILQLNGKEEDV